MSHPTPHSKPPALVPPCRRDMSRSYCFLQPWRSCSPHTSAKPQRRVIKHHVTLLQPSSHSLSRCRLHSLFQLYLNRYFLEPQSSIAPHKSCCSTQPRLSSRDTQYVILDAIKCISNLPSQNALAVSISVCVLSPISSLVSLQSSILSSCVCKVVLFGFVTCAVREPYQGDSAFFPNNLT